MDDRKTSVQSTSCICLTAGICRYKGISKSRMREKKSVISLAISPKTPCLLSTGEIWQNKVVNLRQNLTRFGCDAMIVTALDEIAWLLNIRGKDMAYSPFIKAYLIVERDGLRLYTSKEKISEGIRRQLKVDSYGAFSVRLVEPQGGRWVWRQSRYELPVFSIAQSFPVRHGVQRAKDSFPSMEQSSHSGCVVVQSWCQPRHCHRHSTREEVFTTISNHFDES